MTRLALLPCLVIALPLGRLQAQTSSAATHWAIHLSVGARFGSALVRDSIVNPIAVPQDVGATLAIGVTTPAPTGWSGEAVLDGTWAGLRREEPGANVDLGALTTVTFTVAARRVLPAGASARAGLGAIFYAPEQRTGIFALGTGGATPLGLAGLTYEPPWASRWRAALDLRYDVHRFLTPALRDAGFDEGRLVHRVALAVRAGLGSP